LGFKPLTEVLVTGKKSHNYQGESRQWRSEDLFRVLIPRLFNHRPLSSVTVHLVATGGPHSSFSIDGLGSKVVPIFERRI
jgi:hypothetical protein